MHKFSESDNCEFQTMFSKIDRNGLHPDMKVLYDAPKLKISKGKMQEEEGGTQGNVVLNCRSKS